jgi:hypothetical protein
LFIRTILVYASCDFEAKPYDFDSCDLKVHLWTFECALKHLNFGNKQKTHGATTVINVKIDRLSHRYRNALRRNFFMFSFIHRR